jgi:hypothetical protein
MAYSGSIEVVDIAFGEVDWKLDACIGYRY